jgi:ubiquinone/menaquinone biosynthesis C-methylase UbiE
MGEHDGAKTEIGLQTEFWNEAGGKMWVDNIERTHALLKPLGDVIQDHAAVCKGESVLDVGCGGGLNSVELAVRVGPAGHVLGVDVSETILDCARAQPDLPPNLEFLCADAASEDLGSARFDLLFSRFGVMFFDNPKAAFTTLRGTLKPGGRLAFLCWQAPALNSWLSQPMAAIFEVLPPPEPQPDPRAPGPFAFAEAAWVREILDDAGYQDIEIESLELDMPMGAVDEAVSYMMRFGPAVELLAQADENQRNEVESRIRDAFLPFTREGLVTGPTATWIVTASQARD